MKTILTLMIPALLLTACHHSDRRDDRRSTPDHRRNESYRQERDRSQREWPRHSQTDGSLYRLHSPHGSLPPVGMRWDCPAEPQMLGYVTR
ncbi:MAG: hypothetical protein MJ051_01225 [Akkermansia sp.]|nr:hypothetical protein [Akkermansia sp.]